MPLQKLMLFGRAVLREVNGIPQHPGGTSIAAEMASAQYDDSGAPATRIPFSLNSSPFRMTSSVINPPFGNESKVMDVMLFFSLFVTISAEYGF